MIRRGNQSTSTIPAAPPGPSFHNTPIKQKLSKEDLRVLTQIVRTTQQSVLNQMDCSGDVDETWDYGNQLNEKEAIIFIGCWRGSYQESDLIFITSINALHPTATN